MLRDKKCTVPSRQYSCKRGIIRVAIDSFALRREHEGYFMSKNDWGLCKDCKWWQIEPEATVDDRTVGECIDEKLQPFLIRISGNGGCSRFQKGTSARAVGSSDKPPTAAPSR